MKLAFIIISLLCLKIAYQGIEIKPLIKSREYRYPINNKNTSSFGYTIGGDGVPISAADILVADTVCYILDAAHHNLKIIDLKTGRLVVSQALEERHNVFLTGIIEFNGFIYVMSAGGALYKYNKTGKLLKLIPIENYYNKKFVFSVEKNLLTIFQDADFEQNKEGKPVLNVKRIDLKDRVSDDQIVLSSIDELPNLMLKIHGKKYSAQLVKDKSVLKTELGNFKLEKELPKARYFSTNLDFTKDKVVYFTNDSKQITLCYNQY
jgi:hypothetical protein